MYTKNRFSKFILTGWDYSIIDPHMSLLQKRSNVENIKEKLHQFESRQNRECLFYLKAGSGNLIKKSSVL